MSVKMRLVCDWGSPLESISQICSLNIFTWVPRWVCWCSRSWYLSVLRRQYVDFPGPTGGWCSGCCRRWGWCDWSSGRPAGCWRRRRRGKGWTQRWTSPCRRFQLEKKIAVRSDLTFVLLTWVWVTADTAELPEVGVGEDDGACASRTTRYSQPVTDVEIDNPEKRRELHVEILFRPHSKCVAMIHRMWINLWYCEYKAGGQELEVGPSTSPNRQQFM